MTNRLLEEVACSNCRNPIDVREHGRHVTCAACASEFLLRGHLCPQCSSYQAKEESFCGQCGCVLIRVCRKCYKSGWAGDEYCQRCGAAMDILELLNRQHRQTTADRLQEQMESAHQMKAVEEAASARRMADLQAIEEARQAALLSRLNQDRRRERLLLVLTFGAVSLLIVVLLIYTLLFNLA